MTADPRHEDGAPAKKNRSNEELAMRRILVERLRALRPEARIVHELPLRYSSNRIDLAAISEEEIVAVEIKSSRDVVDRLAAQLRAFKPVAVHVIAALAPKWNPKIPEQVIEARVRGVTYTHYKPIRNETQQIIQDVGDVQTWTVDHETGEICTGIYDSLRGTYANVPHSHALLDMLWREELVAIASRHRVGVMARNPKRPTHAELRDSCEAMMTGQEVRRAVCAALRTRDAFDKMSDRPIVELQGDREKAEQVGAGPTETLVDRQIQCSLEFGGGKIDPAWAGP